MDFNKFNLELSLDKNPIQKKSLEFQLGETTELDIKLKRNDTVISGYTGCTVKLICSNGKVMYEQKNTDSTNPLAISGDTIAAKLTSDFTSLGSGKAMCEVYVIDSDSNTSISERFIIEVISTNYGNIINDVDTDVNLYARMEKVLDAYDNGTLYGAGLTDTQATSIAKLPEMEEMLAAYNAGSLVGMTDEQEAMLDKNTEDIQDLQDSLAQKPDGLLYENEYLYLTANDEVVGDGVHIISGSGGSGSGSGNSAVLSLKNTSGWITKSISSGEDCILNFEWSSIEDEMETGTGSLSVYVNNLLKVSKNVEQGTVTLDITKYISVGSNTIKVNVTDIYGNSRTINYKVSIMELTITSSFDTSTPYTDAFSFPYIATGELSKTVHFIVDGTEIGTAVVPTSGRQLTYTIPAQTHGTHSIEVYFDCVVNEVTVTSNRLYYEFAYTVSGDNTPIIISNFNTSTIKQYDTIAIEYRVYNPASMYCDIELLVNGTSISTLTVDRTEQVWSYSLNTAGTTVMSIKAGDITKSFSIEVEESEINVTETTDSMALKLISQGRSNSETTPNEWKYGDIACQFNNFTFESDGWVQDDDGVTVLRVMNDARLVIPYKPFASDCRATGKTIEIEFATHAISDYKTPMISCMSGGRGFEFTPQKVTFSSEQTSISAQYKEDDHNRVSFVVEKTSENKLILCYLDAVMCYPTQYAANDDFSQLTPVNITIGSNGCVTDIYAIRIYNNDLTRYQILDNWIFDTADIETKLERYARNNIFDAYDQILTDNLPQYLPYMVLEAAELPQYKGDKKLVNGYYVDKLNPSKNFTFTNAQFDVQGTSSQFYTRKNYKMKIDKTEGIYLADGTQAFKYELRDGMIPERTFCLKADVASSEGINNTQLVRYYNDICPYQTPYQEADSRCRQGVDGFPIVIFWNNGNTTQFIGKYNFNLDKSDEDTFGFQDGDESWETLNNTSNRALYKGDDFSTDEWTADFEARYPEDNLDASNLAAFISWVKSTDRTQATNNTLTSSVTLNDVTYTTDSEDYRLAKFRSEIEEHAHLDDLIFYYLFTETFLMIDSRAKNSFPSIMGDKLWIILPYDFDTAMGINNEGQLVFSPFLEDIDKVGSMDVFNGQDSVLWTNLRDAFPDEIKSMYGTLRSSGTFSFNYINDRINEQQEKWGEAVFNEDGYFKYLEPLILDNDASYLGMALGDKKKQRAYWLYNRFKYLDAKYNVGDSAKDVITLRAYSKANITVTPYVDTYATVAFTTPYTVSVRAKADTAYELECKLDNVNDSEFYIYNASNIKDVGDLSPLLVGYADFTKATKLQHLKLGDGDSSYSNTNLGLTDNSKVSLGNNTLLKSIDVRNCPNLSGNFDASGCVNIESILLEGTAVTSVSLPDASPITTLHLPDTVTNLTLNAQTNLSNFVLDNYSKITTLVVDTPSSAVSSEICNIINAMPENSRLRLTNFDISFTDDNELMEFLEKSYSLKGIDENGNNVDTAQLSGKVRISTINEILNDEIKTKYPDITVIATVTELPIIYDNGIGNSNDSNYSTYTSYYISTEDITDVSELTLIKNVVANEVNLYRNSSSTSLYLVGKPHGFKLAPKRIFWSNHGINSNITKIEVLTHRFYIMGDRNSVSFANNCYDLKTLNISNIVWYNCTNISRFIYQPMLNDLYLGDFDVPKNVTISGFINGSSNYYKVKNIHISAEIPPEINASIISVISYTNIYVPSKSVAAYKSAPIWCNYASNILGE